LDDAIRNVFSETSTHALTTCAVRPKSSFKKRFSGLLIRGRGASFRSGFAQIFNDVEHTYIIHPAITKSSARQVATCSLPNQTSAERYRPDLCAERMLSSSRQVPHRLVAGYPKPANALAPANNVTCTLILASRQPNLTCIALHLHLNIFELSISLHAAPRVIVRVPSPRAITVQRTWRSALTASRR
jgi:hypothetical protein